MTSMADALLRAGIIDEDQAGEAKARRFEEDQKLPAKRKAKLRRELKMLIQMSEKMPRREVFDNIESLKQRYADVFDEVATETAWATNLKHMAL